MRSVCVLVVMMACASRPPPVDQPDAIGAIRDAFARHPIVAIDEGGHGNVAVHAFLERLIRDPRFDADDIVVEFGSARYQDVVDRFVAGETVPDLRRIWQETTQVFVWEAPIYERFFHAVREVNAKRSKKLRVVLADPPIDWATVSTWAEWSRLNRDRHAAEVVEREVLAKHRKALLVFGAMHLARASIQTNYEPAGMLVEALVASHPGAVFTIYTSPLEAVCSIGAETPCEPEPDTFTRLANDPMGKRDFASIAGEPPRFGPAGKLSPKTYATRTFADVFDAYLFVGEPTFSAPLPSTFADDAYYRETVRRSHVLHDASLAEIEALHARAH